MAQDTEIRYLNAPSIDTKKKKYCRFKKSGIKYIDYKDPEFLKKSYNLIGLALVLAGAILLIVSYLAGWTSSNLVLLCGLFMIIIGTALHIRQQKKCEKY